MIDQEIDSLANSVSELRMKFSLTDFEALQIAVNIERNVILNNIAEAFDGDFNRNCIQVSLLKISETLERQYP